MGVGGGVFLRSPMYGVVASADLSPDGTHVATGSWDRSAKIWDRATGKAPPTQQEVGKIQSTEIRSLPGSYETANAVMGTLAGSFYR